MQRTSRTLARTLGGRSATALAALALACVLGGCGAKTGLLAPEIDAGRDVTRAPDVVRVNRCIGERVHTQVGFTADLRPHLEVYPASGYVWTLRSQPDGSRAVLDTDGTDFAALSPDVAGEYNVLVEIPATGTSGALMCPIVLIADPPDPRCPGYMLTEPQRVPIPGGTLQLAVESAGWEPPRPIAGTNVGGLLLDAPGPRVAGVVLDRPTRENLADPLAALAAEARTAEDAITREFGATAVFSGRMGVTHDGAPLRSTTLRLGTATVSDSGTLRDRAVRALTGLAPDAGPAYAPAAAYYVDVATALRADTARVVTVVTLTPVAVADDTSQPAGIRSRDLANHTAVARGDATLGVACHEVTASRSLMADFLWLVDTSASMNDDQQRVGDTAERFFTDLSAAGVDFRVGVMEAGSTAPVLNRGAASFQWIGGDDADGARTMAFQVTRQAYRNDPADRVGPYPVQGLGEEPLAAAVLAVREFERQRTIGATNPNFVLREGAARAVFLVTDEPGTNDIARFFARDPTAWGSDTATITSRATAFFTSRMTLPFGLVPSFPRNTCPNDAKLAACVITSGGGAFIPIDLRNDAEVDAAFAAAMGRVVDAVAGAASEFVLPRVPVSSTLRARVDGRAAPRSRADGFDYDDRTRALVFRGPSFRPQRGQRVRAAYFFWQQP